MKLLYKFLIVIIGSYVALAMSNGSSSIGVVSFSTPPTNSNMAVSLDSSRIISENDSVIVTDEHNWQYDGYGSLFYGVDSPSNVRDDSMIYSKSTLLNLE